MTTVDEVIAQAERWLGTVEQPAGSNKVPGITDWYGLTGPWCAMFVSRVFFDAGLPLPASTSKGFAYTPSGAAWFRRQGKWKTTNPARGDVVFFDFPNDGVDRISHVGIVTGVNTDGSINTIEGNTDERGGRTGGKVMRRVRKVGIVGYGIPDYVAAAAPQPIGDLAKEYVMPKPTLSEGAGAGDRAGQGWDVGIAQALMRYHGATPISLTGEVTQQFDFKMREGLAAWQRRTGVLHNFELGVIGPRTWAWFFNVPFNG